MSVMDDYHDEDQNDNTTQDIHPVLAARIDKWLVSKPKQKDLKPLMDKCLHPKNVKNLRFVGVNKPLYDLMSGKLRQWDCTQKIPLNNVQWALCPLSIALDKIVKIESSVPKDNTGARMFKQGNVQENLTDIRRQIDLAVQMVTISFVSMTYRRRLLIKNCIDSQFSAICSSDKPFTDQLFGDDLEAALASLTATNKLRMKAARKTPTYCSRPYSVRGTKNWVTPRLQLQPRFYQQQQQQTQYSRARPFNRRRTYRRPAHSGFHKQNTFPRQGKKHM